MRVFKVVGLSALGVAAVPRIAFAHPTNGGVPLGISAGTGVLALLFAVGLLVQILSLSKIARGSAIADNVSYAVLSAVCLAASVLVSWIGTQILGDASAAQARLGADMLVVVSMAFLGIYFMRVRAAMARFLNGIAAEQDDIVVSINESVGDETHSV